MTTQPASVPIGRAALDSRDIDGVREMLRRRYTDHLPRVVGDTRRFAFRSQSARAGALTVDHLNYRARMSVVSDPHDTMLICSVFEGRMDTTAGRHRGRAGRGEALMLPQTDFHAVLDWASYRVTQFPTATVTGLAGRLGVTPADFRFDAMAAVSPAANRQWLATSAYLNRMLTDADTTGIPALLLSSAIEVAAATVLMVFPNTTMTVAYTAEPGRVTPAAVRRAVGYIDAHAADPISLDDIAAAAGLSPRALQAAFRRHYDTTPTGYLRRVRLEHAHRDLQAADPTTGATVADIAGRWGFANHSRFSAAYHAAYGRLPSQTLRS